MLTREQLDDIIRQNKGSAAVEEMVMQTVATETYSLSDGTFLIIGKVTGQGRIQTPEGKVIRRF